jgi:tyrosyl-tRNA synthetase
MMTTDILADLAWRGLDADCTDREGLARRLAERPITLYAGFDPTADSLHVGNLVPLFALRRFQLAGHHPIALAGGATGMIGDPSGKSQDRNLLGAADLRHHLERIQPQLERFLDFSGTTNPARVVNNLDWTESVRVLDFLRDVGKHITVNSMVAKDSVRSRMEDRANGISFAEFTYMLLQGFDFYHLQQTAGCELQIGATDQWGNITVGTELTRKKAGVTVWGLVLPLLTKADGTKYGKTASGTVWLDPAKTSPYRFYQFFLNTADADAGRLLRVFTFLGQDEIADLEARSQARPEGREAQRALAREMTTLVHGAQAEASARAASEILFGGAIEGVTESTFSDVVGEVPSHVVSRSLLEGAGSSVVDLLVLTKLASSKGQARKDLEGGGVYVNNVRVDLASRAITVDDLLFGKHVLLRRGKRNYAVVSAG